MQPEIVAKPTVGIFSPQAMDVAYWKGGGIKTKQIMAAPRNELIPDLIVTDIEQPPEEFDDDIEDEEESEDEADLNQDEYGELEKQNEAFIQQSPFTQEQSARFYPAKEKKKTAAACSSDKTSMVKGTVPTGRMPSIPATRTQDVVASGGLDVGS